MPSAVELQREHEHGTTYERADLHPAAAELARLAGD
jgi:hypothetical protein